jgi:class 3 adenylate cyclase
VAAYLAAVADRGARAATISRRLVVISQAHKAADLPSPTNHGGPRVQVARRLRELAHGGQILLSGVTAKLIGDDLPLRASLRTLGVHHLRDLIEDEVVVQLVHPRLPADFLH